MAKFSELGLALASAISSLALLAGTDGCAARMCGEEATMTTGAKSLTGSKGSAGKTLGAMASEPMSASSTVRPSGAALATKSAPSLPVAPGLFSTTRRARERRPWPGDRSAWR